MFDYFYVDLSVNWFRYLLIGLLSLWFAFSLIRLIKLSNLSHDVKKMNGSYIDRLSRKRFTVQEIRAYLKIRTSLDLIASAAGLIGIWFYRELNVAYPLIVTLYLLFIDVLISFIMKFIEIRVEKN